MKNLDLMKLVRVREEMFQQVEALRQAARDGLSCYSLLFLIVFMCIDI